MTLGERIRRIDPQRHALRTPGQLVDFGTVLREAGKVAAAVRGTRLAVRTANVCDAIALLVAADGAARSITLVAPSTGDEQLRVFLRSTGSDLLVCDREVTPEDPPVPCRTFAALASRPVRPAPARSDGEPTRWILSTSGTTGQPKLVAHTLAGLTRTTRDDTGKGKGQVWGLLYDYTRFAGMQVVLQSLLSGACLAAPVTTDPLERQVDFLARAGCTHLSATPTLWRKLLMTPGSGRLDLAQVTLGGEIVDDAVLKWLHRTYPGARISHVFASTEAGAGFSVTDRRAGFPASYLDHPPQGIALKIVDGNLWVANDQVQPDYLGDNGRIAEQGWVDTGDQVEIVGDRVHFLGRANGVINVGGNKVHPELVERALLDHPGVRMARVYGKSNPIVGSLVMAEIVPVDGDDDALEADIQSFLASRLDRHMVPASVRLVATLGCGPAGKLERGC